MDLDGIKIAFLERAVKWLASGEAFDLAKIFVAQMVDAEMSGPEKREAVFALLQENLSGFSNVIINIMIEVAVLVITSQISSATSAKTVNTNV